MEHMHPHLTKLATWAASNIKPTLFYILASWGVFLALVNAADLREGNPEYKLSANMAG